LIAEYGDLDAVGLAALIRSGEITALEAVESAIMLAEQAEPSLNALVHRQFDRARRDAEQPLGDGPLAGVPFVLKDYGCAEAGEPYAQGMQALKDASYRAGSDSALALAFRSAGFIPIGRTNIPEMALVGTTEPAAFGPSHNPWNLACSPGGSSGGSAALVAARVVPAGHANDIAGSIRMPAASCGLVGLKPTRGRVVIGLDHDPAVMMYTEGAVTRSVRDVATIIDAVTSHGPGPWPPPPLRRSLHDEVGQPVGRLRIGVATAPFNGGSIDAACRQAALDTATLLASLGHDVVEAGPTEAYRDELWAAMGAALNAHAATDLARWSRVLGRPLGEADVEATSWKAISGGQRMTAADLATTLQTMQRITTSMQRWWAATADGGAGFDVLLTPATAAPAQPIGDYLKGYEPGRGSAFTRPFSASGQPALELPLGWPDDGLPRGVQLIAAYGREDTLIRLGVQLETATPWNHHRPPGF
jgi:amidase